MYKARERRKAKVLEAERELSNFKEKKECQYSYLAQIYTTR